MLAVGYERFGSENELKNDPIAHLFNVYVRINAEAEIDPQVKVEAAKWFKRMEDGMLRSLTVKS